MRQLQEVTIPGRDFKVVARELTVGEIRAWLASKTTPGDLVDSVLLTDVSLSDLLVLTDLTEPVIEELTPSEIDLVVSVVKEINGTFFAMREKVVELGSQLLAVPPG